MPDKMFCVILFISLVYQIDETVVRPISTTAQEVQYHPIKNCNTNRKNFTSKAAISSAVTQAAMQRHKQKN